MIRSAIKNSITQKINRNKLSEEEKERRRCKWARAALKCKKKETTIEIKIKNFLLENKISFIQQYRIGRFICDFYIPNKNYVIECQGDYWHTNPLKYIDYI